MQHLTLDPKLFEWRLVFFYVCNGHWWPGVIKAAAGVFGSGQWDTIVHRALFVQWYSQVSCGQLKLLLEHKRTYCEWVVLMACRLFPVHHQVCWWPSRVSLLWVTVRTCDSHMAECWRFHETLTRCSMHRWWKLQKKKCCTGFWSFNFCWYWENKARRWFYLASNCETGLNLLSLRHRSSFLSRLAFKFRNTIATLAKYKFSIMFPGVTIYCACMWLCEYDRARIPALLFFFIVCQQWWNWDVLQSSTASTLMFLMGSGWNHEGTRSAGYILGILGYTSWVGNDTHSCLLSVIFMIIMTCKILVISILDNYNDQRSWTLD